MRTLFKYGLSGFFALLLPLALIASGCTPARRVSTGNPAPSAKKTPDKIVEDSQIRSALEQVQRSKLDYKIQPGDLLDIKVYKEPDMDRTVRVSGNGNIGFPLAGTVEFSGLSVPEAEAALSAKLSEYIIGPYVNVFIKEYSNKQVYVLGEVKKPGSITLPVERKLTVLEAITLAGGFTDLAAKDKTKVIRNVEGKSYSFNIEVSRITKKGDKSADIYLEPNDVIHVPQSFF